MSRIVALKSVLTDARKHRYCDPFKPYVVQAFYIPVVDHIGLEAIAGQHDHLDSLQDVDDADEELGVPAIVGERKVVED